MSEDGYLYNERLNKLRWKGCEGLWEHAGLEHERAMPPGFRTVGVPGILMNQNIEGELGIAQQRLDALVRGYVGDRWDPEKPDTEYDPIYVLSIDKEFGLIQIAVEGYRSWMYFHDSYEWVEFNGPNNAREWIKAN